MSVRLARLALPPILMFSVALSGITGASFWRDEAATLSAIGRPLPRLWFFLGRTDVVHGVYYLALLPLTRVLGPGELAVRLPSALAVAAAAAGVAAIAARLGSERSGLAAGLMFVAFPVTSRYGQEARSYPIVMALAVAASYLLLRAFDAQTRRWWIAYAATLTLLGWLNLMALLLVPAHAITVARLAQARPIRSGAGRADRRWADGGQADPDRLDGDRAVRGRVNEDWVRRTSVLRSWAGSVLAAGLAVTPLLALAWPQRHGTARFLALTSPGTVADLPVRLTGAWPVLPVVLLLAGPALCPRAVPSPARWLALPWLLLPPILLLGAGAVTPLYDPRYVLFCVPALALLAGTGLDALASPAGPASRATPAALTGPAGPDARPGLTAAAG